jgi:2-haloalkanoic acid dehalogenase type II
VREPRPGDSARVITFDLFSALVDSRTGATAALARLAADRGWDVDPGRFYDAWDAANKASQRDLRAWTSFAGHSTRAMSAAQAELGLDGDPVRDAAELLGTVGDWPLWPDVADGLPAVAAAGYRVGVLSNVDDDVLARTRVGALVGGPVDADAVLTSERLRAYKPAPELYRRAREAAGGPLTHVATSARDVRGALEAGLEVVRLRRPGHALDPAGPRPAVEVGSLHDVVTVLDTGGDQDHDRGTT